MLGRVAGSCIPYPKYIYISKIIRAAGITINEFTRNLSRILQPCELVAATVVSDMNERLSPKKAPPTTVAVIKGRPIPVEYDMPVAIGTMATIVPTLVPMDKEIKHAATNKPARSMLPGSMQSVRFTVASMLPITFAELAKAPANTNIQSINIIFCVLAPLLNVSILRDNGYFPDIATAKMLAKRNATEMGTL